MALFKPRVRPSLTSPQTLTITAPGIQSLTAGVDYRVVLPSTPINGRVWLIGGRNVHVGWGATPSAHGGEIREPSSGRACLIVEDMEECWIEGLALYKFDGSGVPIAGNGIQIRCVNSAFPVSILNCFIDGTGGLNGLGGGSAVSVNNSDAGPCPLITVDGLTCRTFETGITGNSVFNGTFSALSTTRLNIRYGTGQPRNTGTLIEIPATATFFETYLVDDAAPTASLTDLVTGEDTTDAQGNLIFRSTVPAKNGTIFKGDPPAGDWVPEGQTGLNYVAPGYEPGSAAAPLPSTSLRLAWHPDFLLPATTTTGNVGASGGTVTLSSGEKRLITLNSGTAAVTGNVTIDGVAGSGNVAKIIGGQIVNGTENATTSSHCLRVNNVDYLYVEGVKFDKQDKAGDCINVNGAFKLIVIQNCRGVGINTRDIALGHAFTQHGDFFQAQTRGGTILMDKVSFQTWNQGIVLDSSLTPPSPASGEAVILRRVNARVRDTALNPIQPADATHPLFYLQNCCGTSCRIPVWLNDVWGFDEQAASPRTIVQMVSPSASFGTAACGANYDSVNLRASWPVANKITGYIQYGVPAAGDFVPSTFTGLSYVTPGYDGVPIPTVQRGAIQLTLDHVPSAQELVDAAAAARGVASLSPTSPDWLTRKVAVDGAWVEASGVPVRLPAQAAPAAIAPIARADTVTLDSTVGETASMGFLELTQNDLFDPRTRSLVVSATGSPVGCTVAVDENSVNVTPTQQSPVSFSATVQDSYGQTANATTTITGVQPAPPSPTSGRKWIGSPYLLASLANITLKGGSKRTACRFRAPRSGFIKGVRWWCAVRIVDPSSNSGVNYGFGDGGIMRVAMYANTPTVHGIANVPTGGILGGSSNYRDWVNPRSSTQAMKDEHETNVSTDANGARAAMPYSKFPSPVAVTAGEIYHIVWSNADADPSDNWYSVDHIRTPGPGLPVSPAQPDTDWSAITANDGVTWSQRNSDFSYSPNAQIHYTDGFVFGQNIIDHYAPGNSEHENRAVSSTVRLRDGFYPPVTVTAVRINMAGGLISGSGNLICDILTSSGSLIQRVTWSGLASGNIWAGEKTLSPQLTFTAGTLYRLEVYATSGSFNVSNQPRFGSNWNSGTFGNPAWPLQTTVQANNWIDPGCLNGVPTSAYVQRSTNSGGSYSDLGQGDAHLCYYFDIL